jgi:acetyltransferase
MSLRYLHRLFSPHAIAVFGASDRNNSVGGRVPGNLLAAAKAKGDKMMEGEVLTENGAMLSFVKRLGFSVSVLSDEPAIFAVQRTR